MQFFADLEVNAPYNNNLAPLAVNELMYRSIKDKKIKGNGTRNFLVKELIHTRIAKFLQAFDTTSHQYQSNNPPLNQGGPWLSSEPKSVPHISMLHLLFSFNTILLTVTTSTFWLRDHPIMSVASQCSSHKY